MTDIHTQTLAGGAVLTSSGPTALLGATGSDTVDPAATLIAASTVAPTAWHVLAAGTLHLHLPPGASLPPEAGDSGLAWDLARSLYAPATGAPLRASIAVATGLALDAAAVVTVLGGKAAALAAALASMPLPALEEGADAIWDRLAHAARLAQTLQKDGRLAAAALTFRGRGRLIGGLRGDLLIRFGVSTWR